MSSGEQTSQHPPGNVPRPPGALTQLTAESERGWAPPTAGLPSNLPESLTPSAQVRGGRAPGQHVFCTNTRLPFVSHDCLWLSYCFPQCVMAGIGMCVSSPEEKKIKTNAELGSLLKCLRLQLTVVRLCGEGRVSVATFSP